MMQEWLDGCAVLGLRVGFLLSPKTKLKIKQHEGMFTREKITKVWSSTKKGRKYLV